MANHGYTGYLPKDQTDNFIKMNEQHTNSPIKLTRIFETFSFPFS